jgi:hypothetical protein
VPFAGRPPTALTRQSSIRRKACWLRWVKRDSCAANDQRVLSGPFRVKQPKLRAADKTER